MQGKFRMFGAVLALQLFLAGLGFAERIVIYHTSDVHGQYASFQKNNQQTGGFPALAALVKTETKPYILLDSGDLFQGTPEGNVTKGMGSIKLMNELGYKAWAVGNHDYDMGEANLKELIGAAKFPVLGANIYSRGGSRVDYVKPYAIVKVGGVKLGIIGVISETTSSEASPDNVGRLSFPGKAREVAGLIPELKKQGVDAVVVLSHCGLSQRLLRTDISNWLPDDADLKKGNLSIARAAAPGDIAAVLGGHLHTGFSYTDPESHTLFVESYSKMEYTSRIELDVDTDAKKVKSAAATQIQLLVSRTGEDPETLKLVESIQQEVGSEMDKRIGEAADSLERRPVGSSSLGNYVADTMKEATGAEIAFLNTTELRADIKKGPITGRGVFSVAPFDNTIYTMDVAGETLYSAIRYSIRNSEPGVFVSGMSVDYSVDADGKAADVKVLINKVPLDRNRTYTAATTSFIASGGGIGAMFKSGASNRKDSGILIRNALMSSVRKNSPIRPSYESRFHKLGT
jgi:2',3'-cyclic-nucleotide 2'-phosphodiesterase (5'-nucleotidase family)